jgi:hypothetical protein
MSTALRKFQTPEEMAQSLQNEVNTILAQVSEKDIYAEFHERDLIEIENGVEHRIVETSLDQRINMKLNNHQGVQFFIHEESLKKAGKIRRLFYILFKHFEF